MSRTIRPIVRAWLSAALVAVASPAWAEVCRPSIQVKEMSFSPIVEMQRTWSAAIEVDAAACAAGSGTFEIRFVRLKENAVDLPFTERFTWRPGRTEVSLDVWADEAILSYSIGDIAPCPCR